MSSDPSTPVMAQIVLLICLILINAFFAVAKHSINYVNKNKIKLLAQEENKKAIILSDLLENPSNYLSTIQIVITLAGFLASSSAAIGLSYKFSLFLAKLDIPYSHHIAVFIITVILAYVVLVFGELYPKKIALQHAESIALIVAKPTKLFVSLTKPLVWFLYFSVNVVLTITKQKINVKDEKFSEDQVMSMLEVGQETGVLKAEGKKMINSIFAFDDKLAYEVMTPRTDVFYIDINDPIEEYIDELMELRYSRIPVYEDDNDNIIGILHIKDFLIKARLDGFDNVDIRSILRKPYFVPETKNIDSLFFDLQSSKQHIAILIDEYGGFSGIATMEDIIEQVMGNIDDEYDEEELSIEKIDDNTFIVDGFINLKDLDEELNLNLKSENSETLGGLIIDILGEIPNEDEPEERVIEYENCVFKIESVKERRIEKVKLYIVPKTSESDNERQEAS